MYAAVRELYLGTMIEHIKQIELNAVNLTRLH